MAEHLLDCTITKVFEVKKKDGSPVEGEGKHGDWKLYNFYTDKTKKETFTFMWGEGKPKLKQGIKIKHMEYEEEKDGQYTKLNVKKMELEEDKPEPKPTDTSSQLQSNGNREASFYVAYAKDIQVALIQANPMQYKKADLDDLAKIVVNIGLMMADMVSSPVDKPQKTSQKPEDAPQSQNSEESMPELTETEKKELRARFKTYAKQEKDQKKYFKILNDHGASKAEDILTYPFDARQAVLDDLERALGNIPF